MSDDPTQGLDVLSRYEMALIGRLTQFELNDEAFAQLFGLVAPHPDGPLDRVAELEIDTELVHEIAVYLIQDEELGEDFDSSEKEQVVTLGMFIHGWATRFHNA